MKKVKIITILLTVISIALTVSSCKKEKEEPVNDNEPGSLVKTLDLDGKQMDYLHFGNDEGRKLVILPGVALKSVMGSAEAIVSAYQTLAENYDIYLFDHIKLEPEGYSIDDMAEDTITAFKKLGLDHVKIMGVSMGGMVAQAIAIKNPETVDALVLCSTASKVSDSSKTVFETWIKLAKEKDLKGLMESFGEKVYTPSFYEQYKDIIVSSGEGTSETDYQNFIISNYAIVTFNDYDELERIKCPVFVIGAGLDLVFGPQESLDIADRLNCEYYIYEEHGHGVYDEAPDYLTRIKSFLDIQ
ncbi:MAG: alpha/beta hydrolase [Erysipelotrichaceae bacterium]|nr:alpha/beta hydrolase [Erysipelotrichaceae bacterium]